MNLTQPIVYEKPSESILLKYGFEKTNNQNTYEAFFSKGLKAILFFFEGMVRVEEGYDDQFIVRLNKIQLDNDAELEIILRQTFYLPVHKSDRSVP